MDEHFFKELLNISLQMAQTRALKPLLEYAMQAALELVGAESGYLILRNPDGTLDFRVNLDKQGRPIKSPETQVSRTILDEVITSQKPLVILNAMDDASFGQAESVIALRPRSVMCVPLVTYRQTLGAIYVENRAYAEIFEDKDVKPLTYFASQAAVFIENALLNDDLEAQVKARTAELQESQANLQSLIENTRDDIWSIDKDFQIITVNTNFIRNFERYGFEIAPGMRLSETSFDETSSDEASSETVTSNEVAQQKWQTRYARVFEGEHVTIEDVYEQDREKGYYDISLSPITTKDGRITGATAFSRDVTERKQAEEVLQTLNQRMQDELALARKIQQGLLPPPRPEWPHLDVVCYSVSAREVGGDLYAYHAFNMPVGNESALGLDDVGSYVIAVGDVSGKGMPAALLMGVSLALFQSVIRQELALGELLAYLDDALVPYTQTTHQNCALVCIEITTPGRNTGGALRIANAGCISPYLKRQTGEVENPEIGSFALGQGLGATKGYQETVLNLSKGDIVILTSDGVVEANNAANEMFGFERLEAAIATGPQISAEAMLDHLKAEIAVFVDETEPRDDLTIVVARV
ncbi:SpoIIE family protein phosphatase [Chloroflexota bacterium]